MQAILAVVGCLAAVATWLMGGSPMWLVGGLLLGAVIPLTLIVIFPVNRQLLSPDLDPDSPGVLALLERWGRLHAGRSVLSLAAFVIFAWTFR